MKTMAKAFTGAALLLAGGAAMAQTCESETDLAIINGEVEMNLRNEPGPDYRIGASLLNDGSCTITSINLVVDRVSVDEAGNVTPLDPDVININLSSTFSPGQSKSLGFNFDSDQFGIIFGELYRVRWIPNITDFDMENNEAITVAKDIILMDGVEDPVVACPFPPPTCPAQPFEANNTEVIQAFSSNGRIVTVTLKPIDNPAGNVKKSNKGSSLTPSG